MGAVWCGITRSSRGGVSKERWVLQACYCRRNPVIEDPAAGKAQGVGGENDGFFSLDRKYVVRTVVIKENR